MSNPEVNKESLNSDGLMISLAEFMELDQDNKVSLTLPKRENMGINAPYEVGQEIYLSEVGVGNRKSFRTKITSIEPAENNSQGNEQIKVTFEKIK